MTWIIIPLGRLYELLSYRARLSSIRCTFFKLLLTVSRSSKTWPKAQRSAAVALSDC